MKKNIISFVIGLSAGLFGGLVGAGGGLVMIPLMTAILKFNQHLAHGTSLVALVFTGISGALIYGLRGHIDALAAGSLAITAIFTARAGAHFAHALPAWKLRNYFGAFLIVCALLLTMKPCLPSAGIDQPLYIRILICLITGGITGFISGMMGVGGSIIMIPALVLLVGFSQHQAQGTALLVMIPLGISGSLTHSRLGNVAGNYLPGLIAGILMGAALGSHMAGFIPDTPLRLIFSLVITITGIRYVRSKQVD